MKYTKIGLTGVVIAVVMTSSASVSAVSSTAPQTNPVAASNDVKTRVEQRRAKLAEKLSATDSKRIQERCVTAQAKVSQVAKTVAANNDPVIAKYDDVANRINTVMQKQTANGKSVSELNTASANYAQKLQTYKTAYATVTTDLGDATTLDCKTDPAGFTATLKQARTDHEAMITARKDLHTFVKDTLATALQNSKKGN